MFAVSFSSTSASAAGVAWLLLFAAAAIPTSAFPTAASSSSSSSRAAVVGSFFPPLFRATTTSELRADSVRDCAELGLGGSSSRSSRSSVVVVPGGGGVVSRPSIHSKRQQQQQQQQHRLAVFVPRAPAKQQQQQELTEEQAAAAHQAGSSSSSGMPGLCTNLIKSIVGAGALGLPGACAALGDTALQVAPAAAALILLAGWLHAYYFSLLGQVCSWTGAATYRQAWERTVGDGDGGDGGNSNSSRAVAVAVAMKTALACCAYSMILADSSQSLLQAAGCLDVTRAEALLGVTVTALLPLSLQKNLSNLAPFSALGLLGFAVTVATVAARWSDGTYAFVDPGSGATGGAGQFLLDLPAHLQPAFGDAATSLWPEPSGVVLLCTCATAYVAHFNVPRLFHELRDNTVERFDRAVRTSYGISAAIFVTVALFGFCTFGTASQSLILNNYSPHDPLAAACRAALGVCVMLTFPLPFVGLRDNVLDVLQVPNEQREDDWVVGGVSVALLAAITGLACSLDDLGLVMSVGGGTFSTAVAAVFPTLMYRAAVRQRCRERASRKRQHTAMVVSQSSSPSLQKQLLEEEEDAQQEQSELEQAKRALVLMTISTGIGLTGVSIALNNAFHFM